MASDYERIRLTNIREYGEGTRHLAFLGQLYTDRTHFVFELLQNAEDAGARSVAFHLHPDRLEVRHDGRPFTEGDVRGICGVGEGTKTEDLTKIGRFGVGFKSVYSYTIHPAVHSGDEHFRIEHYVRPYAAAAHDQGRGYSTLFEFPFDRDDVAPAEAFAQIAERLHGLNVRTLLFLRSITKITWLVRGGMSGTYERQLLTDVDESPRKVRLVDQTADRRRIETWLVFERRVETLSHPSDHRVEVAFLFSSANPDGPPTVVRALTSPLVVFFPTERETRLGFLIQGPYRTTPSRDNIPIDDPWNRMLMQETALLVSETLPILRNKGLLTLTLLKALPIAADNFPPGSICRPIFESVRSTLLQHNLLPTASGANQPASRVKLTRSTSLRELLSGQQLRQLYGSSVDLYWLPDEITADRESELHAYLRNELGVDELTPESFATRCTSDFIREQQDAWLALFYEFLSNQRALWRGGVLRNRPILRLEDGSQVEPFRPDGSPAAYLPGTRDSDFPTVKRAIAAYPPALEFLRQLGLTEPDELAELRDLLLPRHIGDPNLGEDQHRTDLRTIALALRTDSRSRRDAIVRLLRETPWLIAENTATGTLAFKRPVEMYMPTSELLTYFKKTSGVWFVGEEDTALQTFTEQEWQELGIAFCPRVLLTHPDLPLAMKATLRENAGYTRDVAVDDYELDGLDKLMSRYSTLAPDEALMVARLIWQTIITCLNENPVNDRVYRFRGKYVWLHRKTENTVTFPARWLQQLRSNAWLPSRAGTLHQPEDLTLDDLPAVLQRDERLVKILQIGTHLRASAVKLARLAEEAGVSVKHLKILREHAEDFEIFIKQREQQYERDSRLVARSSASSPNTVQIRGQ